MTRHVEVVNDELPTSIVDLDDDALAKLVTAAGLVVNPQLTAMIHLMQEQQEAQERIEIQLLIANKYQAIGHDETIEEDDVR